jgi:hypothetical protein
VIFKLKAKKPKPVAKMVMMGRRAYGEGWREITLAVDERNDEIVVYENKPVEAPAANKPIYVPAMGNLAMEAVDFLVEGARKSQEYGLKHPSDMSPREYAKWINEQWIAFVENKFRWFKGQSTFGPGGFTQRDKPGRVNWN